MSCDLCAYAPRPTVQEKQRHRIFAFALYMQVMQVDAIEGYAKLRKCVQRRFLRPPVEALAPVIDEAAQIGDIGAIGPRIAPCLAGRGIRKARAGQTVV